VPRPPPAGDLMDRRRDVEPPVEAAPTAIDAPKGQRVHRAARVTDEQTVQGNAFAGSSEKSKQSRKDDCSGRKRPRELIPPNSTPPRLILDRMQNACRRWTKIVIVLLRLQMVAVALILDSCRKPDNNTC